MYHMIYFNTPKKYCKALFILITNKKKARQRIGMLYLLLINRAFFQVSFCQNFMIKYFFISGLEFLNVPCSHE
ncbi:hypothetical protein CEK98_11165 [Listeria monocytogenes]|nr:hypothetical protein [Listeria monocytogenes]